MSWPGLTRPSIVPIERWMAGSAAGHDEIRDYGSMTKWVYAFGDGKAEGKAEMRNLLGGKGANLAEMSNLGLPVPPGLTITTEVCTYYYAHGESYPADLKEQVGTALREVGYQAKGNFGDPDKPLLLSVRSGARVSMPGMMDTVLNLGLNAATAEGLAKITGDARFAYDSYRRFIQMYSDVVLGVDHALFEEILDDEKDKKGVELDTDLDAEDLKRIAGLEHAGDAFEVFGIQVGVELHAFAVFFGVEDFLEQGMFHAQHHIGIHLDEAAIAVIGKARVAGEQGQAFGRG